MALRQHGEYRNPKKSPWNFERYQSDLNAARARVGAAAPEIDYPQPWHNHPLFIAAAADRVRDAIAQMAVPDRERAELIFTAHSIPLAMAARAPYSRFARVAYRFSIAT